MNIRNFVEKISRGIVFKRKLPKSLGGRSIYVTPEGGLRYWNPSLNQIDPMLSQVVKQFIKEGDVVWDIGTNLGFFSLAAISKSKTGKCLSIEPDVWLCNILNKTKNANPDLTIDILPIAVSNKNGFSKFVIANRSRATNHLADVEGSTQTGGVRQIKIVPTFTLDDILTIYEPPNFLKIDTEGAELLVLEGAKNVIQHKPIILIEVYSDTHSQVVEILESLNYKLYDAVLLPELKETGNSLCENIIALPF